jgi:hypothetical protein
LSGCEQQMLPVDPSTRMDPVLVTLIWVTFRRPPNQGKVKLRLTVSVHKEEQLETELSLTVPGSAAMDLKVVPPDATYWAEAKTVQNAHRRAVGRRTRDLIATPGGVGGGRDTPTHLERVGTNSPWPFPDGMGCAQDQFNQIGSTGTRDVGHLQ